ncbi:MAG: gliding motility-associated C-terminal domain-containing protein [Chitinophagales bacterium]|nr:gliding motility-associated C-terminal domain-containing protein [Chitinophagales bacterium]
MKKIYLFALAVYWVVVSYAQCTVEALASKDTIVCGQSVVLSAYGQGQGVALLSENFNNGSFGPGWQSTPQAMWNNPCSPGGVDGTTHIWLGNSSPVPRALTTASFNLSSCANAGVTICFDMKFAEQGDAAPCEGPDEPDEGVYLQYSTNNGTTWTTIQYFDPNGGNDPQFINWTNWCFAVPAAALTANTRFRWFQDADSGADYDHWGIDNVVIYCNDPTYNIVWQHDGYNHGPSGGVNPTPVTPQTTTTYTVVMSNGTTSCTSSVQIIVRNPTLIVNAGADTTICNGQCAQLNATAKVLVSPAKIVTYANNEITPITTGLGQVSNIGINVTGLNMTSILPNSITQVCISNVFFFGANIFPPGQVTIANLILTLTCPSGQTITLVPSGVTTGGSNPLSGGYTNTCFVPAGPNISTGTAPYSGSWAPNQPFNNLAGCTGNGVWTLNVTMNSSLGFGSGTFSGWNITFDDPEISYVGNYSWSPTTNMTGSTTLTPTVCPPPNQYVLTLSDTAGCVTRRDTVVVNTQACCGLSASTAVVQPSCAQSNGSINLTPVPAGNYNYLWSDNNTQQNRTGLAAGTYSVTITDPATPGCVWDTTIVLNSNSTLNISLSNPVNPTCTTNGSITVSLTGGTAPYTVTIDTGGTPQTFNVPFPIPSQQIPNVPAGAVSVSVVDGQGCVSNASATLTAPANCCTFTVSANLTQPACAQSNGSIALTVANGSGNYTYNWSGGLGIASSVANLPAGLYSVTITDNGFANCFVDTSFTLTNPNAPVINNFNITDETCAGTTDGAATVNASGGTGVLSYLWDNGNTTSTIIGVSGGNYAVTVTDANGCATSGVAVVGIGNGCCTMQIGATVTQASCGQNNAVINAAITTAGNPPYTYSIDGSTFQQSGTFSNVPAGVYNVIGVDANQCSDTVSVTVLPSSNNLTLSVAATDVTCFGANDGSATVTPNGGSTPFGYVWSNGGTADNIQNIGVGVYVVSVTDANGCSGSANAQINQPAALIVSLGNDTTLCVGTPVSISPGAGYAAYQWNTNETTATISPQVSGTYTVTVTDANGCTAADAVIVTLVPAPIVDLGDDKIAYEGDHVGLIANISNTSGSGTYNWQPNELVSCNNCAVTVALALDTITYTVQYTNSSGCIGSDTIVINVLPVANIFFPNGFSPNGDGNNDIYLPFGSNVKFIDWKIFNRIGEKIFESNSFFQGWDGTYKGVLQNPAIYVYTATVTLMNNETKKFKGSITLIR